MEGRGGSATIGTGYESRTVRGDERIGKVSESRIVDATIDTLKAAVSRAHDNGRQLANIADSLLGTQPEADGNGQKIPESDGRAYTVAQLVEQLHGELNEIDRQIARLLRL